MRDVVSNKIVQTKLTSVKLFNYQFKRRAETSREERTEQNIEEQFLSNISVVRVIPMTLLKYPFSVLKNLRTEQAV